MDIISTTPTTYVLSNNSVALNCTVKGNPPVDEVIWTATHSLYTDVQFSTMVNTTRLDQYTVFSSLLLQYVTLESRGNYTCLAYNEIQNVQFLDEETIPLFILG